MMKNQLTRWGIDTRNLEAKFEDADAQVNERLDFIEFADWAIGEEMALISEEGESDVDEP